jgi:hypothetical protein
VTTCERIAPLLVSRRLGLLEGESEALARDHLTGCPSCRGFESDVERALEAASLPPVAPEAPEEEPAGWAELSRRIARQGDGGEDARAKGARRTARFVWAGLVLVGATALVWLRSPEPPRVEAPAAAPRVPAPALEIDGRVVSVVPTAERTDVRLSVGADDKVERGQRFSISRGGKQVAEVEVEQVSADSCLCRQVSGGPVEPGDAASLEPH